MIFTFEEEERLFNTYNEYYAFKWVHLIGSPILLIIGTFGNLLAAWVLTSGRLYSRLSTYRYLLVLAVADQTALVMGLFESWFLHLTGVQIKIMHPALCKGSHFLSCFSSHLSVFIICAVSLERLLLTSHITVGNSAAARRAKKIIAGLTLLSLVVNAHLLYFLDVFEHSHLHENWNEAANNSSVELVKIWICDIRENLAAWKQPLAWLDSICYSFIPTFLILSCNIFIIRKLRAPTICEAAVPIVTSMKSTSTSSEQQFEVAERRVEGRNSSESRVFNSSAHRTSRQVLVLLLTISIFFVVTSLPITSLKLLTSLSGLLDLSYLTRNMKHYSIYHLVEVLCELLMYCNHSLNFFLYCAAGKRFRRDFLASFQNPFCKKQARRRSS